MMSTWVWICVLELAGVTRVKRQEGRKVRVKEVRALRQCVRYIVESERQDISDSLSPASSWRSVSVNNAIIKVALLTPDNETKPV
jgi:hypothetical protein